NEWYICTREGIGVGPYETELVARSRADELIKRLGPLKSQDDIMAAIRNFVFETSGLEEERQAS
ncbi:MAG: hypothetical protein KUG75_07255, partial [Pseudomonadales bacterium]|nr:hypothetical protein [Pseudomonadales bacterium]